MIQMTQPKKTTTEGATAGSLKRANDAGVPKSEAELREAGRDFILRHRKTYETLAK